jgi:hypothetical protein
MHQNDFSQRMQRTCRAAQEDKLSVDEDVDKIMSISFDADILTT